MTSQMLPAEVVNPCGLCDAVGHRSHTKKATHGVVGVAMCWVVRFRRSSDWHVAQVEVTTPVGLEQDAIDVFEFDVFGAVTDAIE